MKLGSSALLSLLIHDINKQHLPRVTGCANTRCTSKSNEMPRHKTTQKNRSSFDISKDVVEHREQNNNSSVPAGPRIYLCP